MNFSVLFPVTREFGRELFALEFGIIPHFLARFIGVGMYAWFDFSKDSSRVAQKSC